MKCRFCSDEAVAKFSLDQGCVAFPDDRTQNLCAHHAFKATPIGGLALVEDYTVGQEFTKVYLERS